MLFYDTINLVNLGSAASLALEPTKYDKWMQMFLQKLTSHNVENHLAVTFPRKH